MGNKLYPDIYGGNPSPLAHQDAQKEPRGAEGDAPQPSQQVGEQGAGDGEHGFGDVEKPAEATSAPSKAKEQYAQVHGMHASAVTEELLQKTDEGVEGWACHGLDCRAHGPMGNALYRAFRKNPTMAKKYRWLFDDLKVKFRQTWAMSRSFDFQYKSMSLKSCAHVALNLETVKILAWTSRIGNGIQLPFES